MGEAARLTASILGKIAGLFREFNKLAAGSGTNVQTLTRNLPSAVKRRAPDAHEGMLGSLILEQLITPVFSQVAADFIVDTPQGSFTGTISALDLIHDAGALDGALEEKTRRATDDARYKKGAGKGTDALLFGNARQSSLKTLLNGPLGDRGRGYFTSPFNSRAHRRLESALIEASQQLMDLKRFEAGPA